LISRTERTVSEAELSELEQYCTAVHVLHLSKIGIYMSLLKALFTGKAFQQAYFFRAKIAQQIKSITADFQPDMIYCQLIRMAAYCEQLPYPKTLDYMDALSLGMRRRATHSTAFLKPIIQREARLLLQLEQRLLDVFDHHTIISAVDATEISPEKKQIQVTTNGVDTQFFAPQNKETEYELVFVGNMGYFPNVQAALYLANEMLPLLSYSDKLLLAGARPSGQVQALQSKQIQVSGWMDDIREAYAAGRIFVAPLFTGSGQQNKILEAMAMGIPCVTTPIVNDAIGAKEGMEILVGTDAQTLVEQVKRLQEDKSLYQKMKVAGRKFGEERYSWRAAVGELANIWA